MVIAYWRCKGKRETKSSNEGVTWIYIIHKVNTRSSKRTLNSDMYDFVQYLRAVLYNDGQIMTSI